jgi:hypothetical protein
MVRALAFVLLLVSFVLLVYAGVVVRGEPAPPEPGPAARKVTVVKGDTTYALTAEVTSWTAGPHPQAPGRGTVVDVFYRFSGFDPGAVELQVCAVDEHRVVLGCGVATDNGVDEEFIGPSPELSRTAAVLLLPDQMFAGLHKGDPKDGDDYVPPRHLRPGDQL